MARRTPFIPLEEAMVQGDAEAKLPAWARGLIDTLRVGVRTAEEHLAAHRETRGVSDTWFGEYDNKVYLPTDSIGTPPVHFGMKGPGSRSFDEIQVRQCYDIHNRGALDVNGGGRLIIEMISSNNFRVRLADS